MLEKIVKILKKMENFSRTKKKMFLPIGENIAEALSELSGLRIEIRRAIRILNILSTILEVGLERKKRDKNCAKRQDR